MTNQHESQAEREIVISRVFDAPRDLVWKAWTGTFDSLAEFLAK